MNWTYLLYNFPSISVLDCAIILILVVGAVYGSKVGFIKSTTSFVGTILALIGAFFLKNPVSIFMYTKLPFFKFNGIFKGLTSLNILVYEAIAFILVLSILITILRTIVKLSGLIEKILDATIILGIPSKILGAIFGAFETYIFIFIIIFFLNQFPTSNFIVNESQVSLEMLTKTPILSGKLSNAYNSFNEIYNIALDYNNTGNTKVADSLAFEILLKNEIITKNNAQKLIDSGKIDNELCVQILNNYKE